MYPDSVDLVDVIFDVQHPELSTNEISQKIWVIGELLWYIIRSLDLMTHERFGICDRIVIKAEAHLLLVWDVGISRNVSVPDEFSDDLDVALISIEYQVDGQLTVLANFVNAGLYKENVVSQPRISAVAAKSTYDLIYRFPTTAGHHQMCVAFILALVPGGEEILLIDQAKRSRSLRYELSVLFEYRGADCGLRKPSTHLRRGSISRRDRYVII